MRAMCKRGRAVRKPEHVGERIIKNKYDKIADKQSCMQKYVNRSRKQGGKRRTQSRTLVKVNLFK